nr:MULTISPECIES: hypothetical protein [unclassified Mesorhizobium]
MSKSELAKRHLSASACSERLRILEAAEIVEALRAAESDPHGRRDLRDGGSGAESSPSRGTTSRPRCEASCRGGTVRTFVLWKAKG